MFHYSEYALYGPSIFQLQCLLKQMSSLWFFVVIVCLWFIMSICQKETQLDFNSFVDAKCLHCFFLFVSCLSAVCWSSCVVCQRQFMETRHKIVQEFSHKYGFFWRFPQKDSHKVTIDIIRCVMMSRIPCWHHGASFLAWGQLRNCEIMIFLFLWHLYTATIHLT